MPEIDIGNGFYYKTFTEDGVDGPTGIIIYGPAGPDCPYKKTLELVEGPGICGGGVSFENSPHATKVGKPRWKVEQKEPLTLSPSIACKCNFQHGFIREGRYVNA